MDRFVVALKECLHPGKYVVAFSGGSDSVALVSAAVELHKLNASYDFVAVHVEHGLRGDEGLRDMEFAQSFCHARGLTCHVKRVDVPARVRLTGDSVEQAARDLRYRALLDVAIREGAKKIITAHHANDQAETLLLHLVRGSGLKGLGGMQRETPLVLRPFLGFSKQELMEYCRSKGAVWVEDGSNNDIEYSRNYVRQEVMPLLLKLNPMVVQNLCQTAKTLQEDEAVLNEVAEKVLQQRAAGDELATEDWAVMPAAVRKRVIKLWLMKYRVEPSWTHISNLDRLITNGTSNKELALPGVTVKYAYRKIIVSRNVQHIRH